MKKLALAFSFARRDLRGGRKRFRIFLSCIVLGVAAIAGIGSISSSIVAGLASDGAVLLGGDVAVRLVHRPATGEQRRWMGRHADVSEITYMRSMAHRTDGAKRTLINLKSVDGAYPLYGALELDRARPLEQVLERRDGEWGAAVDPSILNRLDAKIGDSVRIGSTSYRIRAAIRQEPDRLAGARAITYGPRFIVARNSLTDTGLVRPGAQIRYEYRVRLANGQASDELVGTFRGALDATFPDAGWRVRDRRGVAPGTQRIINRTTQFITLVGLAALLIGGVGAGNAVRSYLGGKMQTIAMFKCIGADARLVFMTWLIEIALMTALGIAIGIAVGAALPILASWLLSGIVPTPLRIGLYPEPLLLAALYGALVAATFSIWPVARAASVAPGGLFRDAVAPARANPGPAVIATILLCIAALSVLAISTAHDRVIASWFVGGSIAAFGLFHCAGRLVMALARRAGGMKNTSLRLALANLHRPGAQTANVVLSMGLGLTVLIAVVVVEGNLARQIRDAMPKAAPAFFFIDIQPDQIDDFERTIRSAGAVDNINRMPMLRGRIAAINGTPSREFTADPGVRWVLRGDRGLTWSASPPEGAEIVEGKWWPADYSGPPLISFDERAARGFGIGVGDRLTINVLGRPIEATIANLRRIKWRSLRVNFVIVFSPGVIEAAPQTHIAAIRMPRESENAIEAEVVKKFANITAVRVRDVLDALSEVTDRIASAVRVIAGVTVLAGALVLGGAIGASRRLRLYDSVVLKVLGARRREIVATLLVEYGLLASATALLAAIFGSIAGWAVLTQVMRMEWAPVPEAVAATAAGSAVFIVALALIGTWRSLGQTAAPMLRNE
jgi:putative ABC transport system permease protein